LGVLDVFTTFAAVLDGFAGAEARFSGTDFGAACVLADLGAGFGFGLLTSRAVDFAGRAEVAFDAATLALDRGFKSGWAAFG